MTDFVAQGRANRAKGGKNERDVVAWLRGHGFPRARRYLAGDGRQPGDIDGLPFSLEVRARAKCMPGTWLTGAESAAEGQDAVVLYHPPGVADVGRWVAMVRFEDYLTLRGQGKDNSEGESGG